MRSTFVILVVYLVVVDVHCHIRNAKHMKHNEDETNRPDHMRDGYDLPSIGQQFSAKQHMNYMFANNGPPRNNFLNSANRYPSNNNRPNNAFKQDGFYNGKSTRSHPVFHEPPPRFVPPLENNKVDTEPSNQLQVNNGGSKDQNEQWPLPLLDNPKIVQLDVKCEKNLMKVAIEFDKPFNGVIFSKGHYNYRNCLYLGPNTGRKHIFFDISINTCGTMGNAQGTFYNEDITSDSGQFFENTVIIQYDPQVQEAWDQARKLRCTWHDQYEKAVSFRPFPVDMLDVVRADFAGDNVGCWMQIQVGKGPWASEVAGIVKIGQTMTMVLAIKDEENKFDMLVRNCIAHDGKRAPIELVDSNGCIMRPKIMTKFTKIKNFGSSASVLSYTHFQAFKFPDSMEVHFQCTIQICRYQCPDQCTQQPGSDIINLYNNGDISNEETRKRRDVSEHVVVGKLERSSKEEQKEIGLNKAIQVVSPRDLSFQLNEENQMPLVSELKVEATLEQGKICITTYSFIWSVILVALVCVVATIITKIIFEKKPSKKTEKKHFSNGHVYMTYLR